MDLNPLVNRIDLSSLKDEQQKEFKNWLEQHPNTQVSINNALRKGQIVKAQMITYRKQVQYSVRIEE